MGLVRQMALEGLLEWLESLEGSWTVVVWLSMVRRPWRIPWPRDGPGKKVIWERIRTILLGARGDGEVHLVAAGSRSRDAIVIPWPEPADLFSRTEPPEVKPPRQTTTEADGRQTERPVHLEIEGLTFQMVKLRDPPRKANKDCARAILQLLYAEQKRFTGEALEVQLQDCQACYPWSFSVVSTTATWLKSLGLVNSERDSKGSGYGLVSWSVDPLGGEMDTP